MERAGGGHWRLRRVLETIEKTQHLQQALRQVLEDDYFCKIMISVQKNRFLHGTDPYMSIRNINRGEVNDFSPST